MQTEVSGSQRTARVAALKGFGFGALVVGLIALVAFAVFRENFKPAAPAVEANASFVGGLSLHAHEATALSPEEEAYAAALWPIHSEVKLAAVRMIFAGLAYKTEDHDAKKLRAKVQPLTQTFEAAGKRVAVIKSPASLQEAHKSYVEAVKLYSSATREMIKVADDGRDEHLIQAQQRSEQASLAILKLSDVLWPGEYKPN
jgi:hypothetical protein